MVARWQFGKEVGGYEKLNNEGVNVVQIRGRAEGIGLGARGEPWLSECLFRDRLSSWQENNNLIDAVIPAPPQRVVPSPHQGTAPIYQPHNPLYNIATD